MSGSWIRIVGAAALSAALAGAQNYEAPYRSAYTGPAVLSRGEGSGFLAPFQTIRLRPFVSAQGVFASNLASADQQDNLAAQGGFGTLWRAGVVGSKQWKSQTLLVGYNGGYINYPHNRFFNGPEQTLNVEYRAQLTRRVAVRARQIAGTSTRPMFQMGLLQMDPRFFFVPNNEFFDNRLYFATSSGDLTVRLTPRWSANLGGDYFLNRRRSTSLFGVEGARARGDVVYRLSRTSTVGVTYNFLNFRFSRAFGGSDLHSAGVVFSQRVGRNWEFSTQVVGSRLESLGLTRVAVDPEVRHLVGSDFVSEVAYRIQYLPQFGGRVTRRIRRGSLSAMANRSVIPGNGVFLTSRITTMNALYSHHYSSRLSFFAGGGWDRLEAIIQSLRPFGGYTGTGGMAYSLDRFVSGLSLTANLAWMQRRLQRENDRPFHRDWMMATVGLAWSPGEYPLAFW
jgi:hypothetical protein